MKQEENINGLEQILNKHHNQSFTKNFNELPPSQPKANLKWQRNAEIIAGRNGKGDELNQLSDPEGIYVDDKEQCIYIADYANSRIVKWKLDGGSDDGEIVAGGNSEGDQIDQLNKPTDVILDETKKSLIICDRGNSRVVRWPLENTNGNKEILIENILCYGLMMNANGDLFVTDHWRGAVKVWRKGEIGKGGEGIIVAGGNGLGIKLNQFHSLSYIFIDREETIYVSDSGNNRVMKWLKGANEGIIVAGGRGQGNSLRQLDHPYGLVVNEIGDVYVADCYNHRIMCWSVGSKEGRVIIGRNGREVGSSPFFLSYGLSFDVENNLYVADHGNHRILRFRVDKNL